MIREATGQDLPALTAMGVRFLKSTHYKDLIKPAEFRIYNYIKALIKAKHCRVFVAERGEKPAGMIGVIVHENPLSGELTMSEAFWWVEPEHRGCGMQLYRRALEFGKSAGVKRIEMLAPNEKVATAYRKLGFSKAEETYIRSI